MILHVTRQPNPHQQPTQRHRMRTCHAPMPPRNLRHNRQPPPAAARQITCPQEALEDVRVLGFAQADAVILNFENAAVKLAPHAHRDRRARAGVVQGVFDQVAERFAQQ